MQSSNDPGQGDQPASPLSPLKGVLVVLGVAVVVVIFVALMATLHISEFWAGFLWLFYWAAIEQMRFERLAAAMAGAALGLATAFAMQYVPPLIGNGGLAMVLLFIAAMVYCQVMGLLTLVVNNATMLFLTVGTIPHLQVNGDFSQIFMALFIGVMFFGGLLWSVGRIVKKRSPVMEQ